MRRQIRSCHLGQMSRSSWNVSSVDTNPVFMVDGISTNYLLLCQAKGRKELTFF